MPAPSTDPSLKLLYVEDDVYVRETMAMVMEDGDWELVTCGTAEEALEHLNQRRFDALLTDQNLPRRSGLELAAAALARDPLLTVLICSGSDVGSRIAGLHGDVVALRKPFEVDALDAALAAAAGRVRARRPG